MKKKLWWGGTGGWVVCGIGREEKQQKLENIFLLLGEYNLVTKLFCFFFTMFPLFLCVCECVLLVDFNLCRSIAPHTKQRGATKNFFQVIITWRFVNRIWLNRRHQFLQKSACMILSKRCFGKQKKLLMQ